MPLFTRETASQAAIKGNLVRWHSPKPLPSPAPTEIIAVPTVEPATRIADSYRTDQLMRVKQHIERLHGLMEAATEPMDIDRLARALNTLLDRARILAGEPLLKPVVERRAKQSTSLPDPT